MSSRAASPRVLVFAAVVAAHAGALLTLLEETRTRLVRGEAEASPLIVMLFQPRERQAPAVSLPSASRAPAAHQFFELTSGYCCSGGALVECAPSWCGVEQSGSSSGS
jgi:hypothetical protein